MQCPICSVALIPAERQGVEIDYCPKCRGIWLDRGELDRIVERTGEAFAPANPRLDRFGRERDRFGNDHDDHDHDDNDDRYRDDDPRRRRRGGFLDDLFDIG